MKRHLKYLFFALTISGCNPIVSDQQENSDSGVTQNGPASPTYSTDTTRVNELNELAWDLKLNNPDTSILLGNESLALAEKLNWKKGIATSLGNLGGYYYLKADYPQALSYIFRALEFQEELKNKKEIARLLGYVGLVYMEQGDYVNSLDYNLKALKIAEEIGDESRRATLLGNIGNVYLDQLEYSKALTHYLQALEIDKLLENKNGIARHLGNIGLVYKNQQDYPKALTYYLEAIKLDDELDDPTSKALHLGNVGGLYNMQNEPAKALEHYFMALETDEQIGNKNGVARHWGNIGILYVEQGDYLNAHNYLFRALALYDSIGAKDGVKSEYFSLSMLYEKSNIPLPDSTTGVLLSKEQMRVRSLHYYKRAIAFRDSVYSQENKKQLLRKELNYGYEKKDAAKKAEQEKKDALAAEELKQKEHERNYFVIGFGLVIVFALFIFRGYRQKQKANDIITRQKQESEKQRSIIEEKNKDITGSITYAQRIQQAILPSIESIKEKFPDSFVLYKPKDIIAGDFYWVSDAVTKDQESFMMAAVADCTGHGVPGALMSIIGNNYLRLCEREATVNRPSEALDFINAGISRTLRQEYSKSTIQDGMDMVFIAIDYSTMQLHFAGAKNSIYIVRAGKLTEYKGDKHPVGAFVGEEMKKFTNHTIQVEKDDCVYLFSDGYADQFGGPKGKKFMYSRFQNLLAENSHLPMEKLGELLEHTFNEWKGDNEQVDDVCVVGIRI